MRAWPLLCLLPALACTESSIQADFTGLNLEIGWEETLALARIELRAERADGREVLPLKTLEVAAPPTPAARRAERITIVLGVELDREAVHLALAGKNGRGEVVATGTAGATLALGELLNVKTALLARGICGDGRLQPGEDCDDGGALPGDGCAQDCRVEADYACASQPSACYLELGVVHVDASARPCGDGSRARPFCTLAAAAAAPRVAAIFVRAGVYPGALVLDGVRLSVHGERGARLEGTDHPLLGVRGGAVVTLTDLEISGGGVELRGLGTQASLRRLTIGPGAGPGLSVREGAQLTLGQSTVRGRQSAGLELDSSAPFLAESSLFLENATTSSAPAVLVRRAPAGSRLVNLTLARNGGGLTCVEPAELVNSIVWNSGPVPTSSACQVRYSDLGPGGVLPPGENFSADPLLDGAGRLLPGSPCIDRGDPAGVVPAGPAPQLDLEGEVRPRGSRVDVGADEAG